MFDKTQEENEFTPLPNPEDTVAGYLQDEDGDIEDATYPDNVTVFPGTEVPEEVIEPIVDYTIEYGDRTFTIEEPDVGTIIRLLNFVGNTAANAERFKAANFGQGLKLATEGNYDMLRAELYSFASILSMNQILQLSAIVFFGGRREKEGYDYFKKQYESDPRNIKIAPLIKAIGYSLDLSSDLREAMGNFRYVRAGMRTRT